MPTASPPQLSIVVPCFNEEAVLPETAERIAALLRDLKARGRVAAQSSAWFVDDGSRDRTWSLIETLCASDPCTHGLKLSRNYGHQNALLAGLLHAPGDVIVSLDADLQDDPNAIEAMLEAHQDGAELVFGVRSRREQDTPFKRVSASAYYSLLQGLGVDIIKDHADYRLMTRRAIEALRGFGESNLFLRGIVPQLGFRSAQVRYARAPRFAGESKYPLRRMLAFAVQGVTSFSAAPLRAITLMGTVVSLASFMAALWVLWAYFVAENTVPGWASTLIPIFFLGGIQLLSLGVIGEYVAKIHLESKHRPRFIVERTL